MKMSLLTAASAAFALAGAAQAFAASPVGEWSTPDKHGVVSISECDGGALCGKIVNGDDIRANPGALDVKNQDASKRTRTLKGMTIFYGVTGGPTEWKGGSVYNPEDGKTYHGSIKLVDDDTLTLSGCVWGPLCKSQTWHRIK